MQERERKERNSLPFSADWSRTFAPRYFSSDPADFHGILYDQLSVLHRERSVKAAIIAPREGAKSTLITFAYVLHCAVEKLESYILILSDSKEQAADRLMEIRAELEDNDKLADHYADACGIGPVWRQDKIELRNGVVIHAIGCKGKVRGKRNREVRPSLIVFDDVENNESIISVKERQRRWKWATREVIPAGSSSTNFLSVGSALHRECVALKLGSLVGWQNQTHKAIHHWPERMDLWLEWERRATNPADMQRGETGLAYYQKHKEEMDRGSAVYWPAKWSLYDLMKRRAEIGASAFECEYQGVPQTEGMSEWPEEYFSNPENWFDEWPEKLVLQVAALDPSKGADSKSGDFQAHVVVGLARDGTLFIEADLRREPVDMMIARALEIARTHHPLQCLAVEDNDSLGMLVSEFERQTADLQWVVPLLAVHQSVNKTVRIRRLGVYFARDMIRFRNTVGTRMLVDQARDFPNGDNDDGIDALELACRMIEDITVNGGK